jgi:hypothetical protein
MNVGLRMERRGSFALLGLPIGHLPTVIERAAGTAVYEHTCTSTPVA